MAAKNRRLFVAVLAGFFLLNVFSFTDAGADEKKIKIVATIYPLALFAKNLVVGVPGVDVELLTDNAQGCLHDYVLKPSDIKKIQSATLVLMNGGDMEEGGLAELLGQLSPMQRWSSNEALPAVVKGMKGQLVDDHYFADPKLVPLLISSLTERLVQLLPQQIALLRDNLDDYLQRLKKINEQPLPNVATTKVVVLSDTIERTVRSFGFVVVPLFYESEFHKPTPRQVAEAPKILTAEKIRFIFVEAGIESRYASQLASMSGATVVVVDPVIRGVDLQSLDYYEKTMQNNLQTIQRQLAGEKP